jgi:hypothetical protein
LILTEIEKEPYNFWSWHALSCLFASNDNVVGACNVLRKYGYYWPSMELINLLVFQGKYADAMAYSHSRTQWTRGWPLDREQILKALSSPPSPQIRSIIPNQRNKEMSLERYIPKTLIAHDSASNPI